MNKINISKLWNNSLGWCNKPTTIIITTFIFLILGGYLGYLAYINSWLG